MYRYRTIINRHRALAQLAVFAVTAVTAFVAFTVTGYGHAAYYGPVCQPQSRACSPTANGGPWVPSWYYLSLWTAQTAGLGAKQAETYVPDVDGKQPTISQEQNAGATLQQASHQQLEQQLYVQPGNESATAPG